MTKRRKIVLTAMIVFVSAVGAVGWLVCKQFSAVFSGRQVTSCPIPLPPEARNVKFAGWSAGLGPGFQDFVRFEAPAQVCLNHMNALATEWAGRIEVVEQGSSPATRPAPDAEPITEPPSPIKCDDSEVDTSWFDVHNIRHGRRLTFTNRRSMWVDTDRGIFYYYWTD